MIISTNFMVTSSMMLNHWVIGWPCSPILLKITPNAIENIRMPRIFNRSSIISPSYSWFQPDALTSSNTLFLCETLHGFIKPSFNNLVKFSAEFLYNSEDPLVNVYAFGTFLNLVVVYYGPYKIYEPVVLFMLAITNIMHRKLWLWLSDNFGKDIHCHYKNGKPKLISLLVMESIKMTQ